MVLDSLSLTANINEYVMMSYSFVGCGEIAVAGLSLPGGAAPPDPPAFSPWTLCTSPGLCPSLKTKRGLKQLLTNLVKSISLDVNMNRDTDNASALGSATYSVALPPQALREITGSIELNDSNDKSGAATNHEPTYDELRSFLLHNGFDAAPALMLKFEDASGNSFSNQVPEGGLRRLRTKCFWS